jgi:hypothetical protein
MSALAQLQVTPDATVPPRSLQPGERLNHVAFDPQTGDYRVYHLSLVVETANSPPRLRLELHRQGPGFDRRAFMLLDDVLDTERQETLQPLMPTLAHLAMLLRARKMPPVELLAPFMTRAALRLWTKPLPHQRGGSHE